MLVIACGFLVRMGWVGCALLVRMGLGRYALLVRMGSVCALGEDAPMLGWEDPPGQGGAWNGVDVLIAKTKLYIFLSITYMILF